MLSIEYSEAITETLDILKHTRKEDVDKISTKFMDFLNANASKTYKPNLDHTKRIKDMQLKQKTKVILAIIYKKFWCDSEKLEEFNKMLKENEIKHEKELKDKYKLDFLTKNNKTRITNSMDMIEYKESLFKRFIKKLKDIFHIR